MICYLKKNPCIFINACCFVSFIVQMSILVKDQISPSQTVSNTEEKKLDDIEFPVLFKMCIKPSFNLDELQATGYQNIWNYFIGQSMHNGSLFGWAGHTEDGEVFGSVKGILPHSAHQVAFICR